ncbi:NADH pyrophosphatase [Cronobacter malonaticus 507]|nr:NADH pyrophosphatase [Cronobacter malonaticus 507]
MFHVSFLGVIHHLHGRIVLHQRQVAVHRIGGFPDRLADKFARGVVIRFQHLHQRRIFSGERFLRLGVVDRARFGFAVRHLPFAAVVIQHQIDDPQMIAPHARHHRRHAVQRTFGDIRAFDGGEIFTGEDRVRMAEENGIHARHLAQVVHRVFRHRFVWLGGKPGVRDHDHQIGAFRAHLRHIFTGGFGDIVDRDFAAEVRLIPRHDLRRHKPDVADFQRMRLAVFIFYFGFFNQVRRKKRLLGFGIDDVRVDVREFRASERFMQVIEAVIEFMVAEVADGVVQHVQRFVDRMHVAVFQALRGHVIAQRAALDEIAVIHQHAVGGLLARGFD